MARVAGQPGVKLHSARGRDSAQELLLQLDARVEHANGVAGVHPPAPGNAALVPIGSPCA
eukprot:scaffold2578_cov129-Isochrysis_galbana.AAC.2